MPNLRPRPTSGTTTTRVVRIRICSHCGYAMGDTGMCDTDCPLDGKPRTGDDFFEAVYQRTDVFVGDDLRGLGTPEEQRAKGRILAAALDYCKEEYGLREMRKNVQRCTEMSAGDPSIGDPGVGPCDMDPAYPDRCEACEERAKALPVFHGSLKRRYAAKRRMMTAYARLDKPAAAGSESDG